MNPYSPAFVPGNSSQKGQDRLAIRDSNTPYSNGSFPTGSQVPTLLSLNMSSQVLPRSNKYSYGPLTYSEPPMIAQLPYQPGQPEIVSPITRRATSSLLQKLNNLEIQEPSVSAQAIAAYRESVDKTTNPSEMPIGSLVDHREPPSFGVVKISNIPYSITKQEILQFLGRQARLITPEQGCPIHIIMERSTAKTMDCYAEFQTHGDARDTANRINRIYESGRPPRLGNRHVDVDLTDQNELLKDLFPRAKCIVWRSGMPYPQENSDPYCSGFTGFFTAEEIILAIRHAEIPHRSPFCDKCPQRTYESTISTLHKFPWYAPKCYTVHDRNQLFELVNRHIQSLVSRIKRVNTVGLDQKLLNDLLHAGLKCPTFNERQKYTLCINSEISSEIVKLPETSKWFPFDSLARKPNFDADIYMYFMTLISQGSEQEFETMGLSNTFPKDVPDLRSPFGQIWFEWPQSASQISWETAVHHEMVILCTLVFNGWMNDDMNNVFNDRRLYGEPSLSLASGNRRMLRLSPSDTERSLVLSHSDARASHLRRASESMGMGNIFSSGKTGNTWNHRLLLYPPGGNRRGHRNTQSSPMCLPSPTTNPWGDLSSE